MNPITAPPARQKTVCSLAAFGCPIQIFVLRTFSLLGEKSKERGLCSLSLNVCGSYVHSRRRTADRVCDFCPSLQYT